MVADGCGKRDTVTEVDKVQGTWFMGPSLDNPSLIDFFLSLRPADSAPACGSEVPAYARRLFGTPEGVPFRRAVVAHSGDVQKGKRQLDPTTKTRRRSPFDSAFDKLRPRSGQAFDSPWCGSLRMTTTFNPTPPVTMMPSRMGHPKKSHPSSRVRSRGWGTRSYG